MLAAEQESGKWHRSPRWEIRSQPALRRVLWSMATSTSIALLK